MGSAQQRLAAWGEFPFLEHKNPFIFLATQRVFIQLPVCNVGKFSVKSLLEISAGTNVKGKIGFSQ
jgi:hypothetical protein